MRDKINEELFEIKCLKCGATGKIVDEGDIHTITWEGDIEVSTEMGYEDDSYWALECTKCKNKAKEGI